MISVNIKIYSRINQSHTSFVDYCYCSLAWSKRDVTRLYAKRELKVKSNTSMHQAIKTLEMRIPFCNVRSFTVCNFQVVDSFTESEVEVMILAVTISPESFKHLCSWTPGSANIAHNHYEYKQQMNIEKVLKTKNLQLPR